MRCWFLCRLEFHWLPAGICLRLFAPLGSPSNLYPTKGKKKNFIWRLVIVVETIRSSEIAQIKKRHRHLAQWLVNLFEKENSTITHSQSCLMRNCISWSGLFVLTPSFLLSTNLDGLVWWNKKEFDRKISTFSLSFSCLIPSLQMHSRFLMFVWRKKLLLFATGILMVLTILLWGFVYSSHVNHDDTNKGLSIKVGNLFGTGKNLQFTQILANSQELMLGNKQTGLLHKLGLNGREINFNHEPIRFFKPTASNLYSLGRKGNWTRNFKMKNFLLNFWLSTF